MPGLTDFMIFKIYNREVDVDIYGGSHGQKEGLPVLHGLHREVPAGYDRRPEGLRPFPRPRRPLPTCSRLVKGYLGDGCKMGEGWLLTAEMLELIHSGTNNIVCAQPFGCLPNHIVGKGMIRKLKDDYPNSNIVAIDYDPGATKINQENRIKLMLANAKGLAAKAETSASGPEAARA